MHRHSRLLPDFGRHPEGYRFDSDRRDSDGIDCDCRIDHPGFVIREKQESSTLLRLALFILMLSLLAGCSTTHEQIREATRTTDMIMNLLVDRHEPGLAIAVVKDGQIHYTRGFGTANLEYDVPITSTTPFHVASLAKQFTAFAILLLEQDGKLSLDDDVRTYLDDFPDFRYPITIRQLLNHTSGLRDQWELLLLAGWRLDDIITQEQILRMIRRQETLNFPPGSAHLYSNSGYTVLAEIVEAVTGRSFPDWTHEQIFRPLEMHDSHFYEDHEEIVSGRAYSYSRERSGTYRKQVLNYATAGATSLFTTVKDLGKWLTNFSTAEIGGKELIHRMLEHGQLSSGEEIPYGFALIHEKHFGLKVSWHGGADAGYRSFMAYYPDQDFGIVVLSNTPYMAPDLLGPFLAGLYLKEQMRSASLEEAKMGHHDKDDEKEPDNGEDGTGEEAEMEPDNGEDEKRVRAEKDDEEAADALLYPPPELPYVPLTPSIYEGRYYSHELDTAYEVKQNDHQLLMKHPRQGDMTLMPAGPDLYHVTIHGYLGRVPEGYLSVGFKRDNRNRITGLYMSSIRVHNLFFEKVDHP